MKKARTLLAIWLALILTLTLFPTALAEPTTDVAEPFTATYTTSEGITFNSNPTTVEPNTSLKVTFTVADGYELKDVTIAMGETSNYNGAQLSQNEQTYTYTIPSVTGNVTFTVTAEKTATDPVVPPVPNNTEFEITLSAGTGEFPNGKNELILTTSTDSVVILNDSDHIPTLADHYFLGWYDATAQKNYMPGGTIENITGDMTLSARFLHGVTVVFEAGDGVDPSTVTNLPTTQSNLKPEGTITLGTPSRAGYRFDGWSDGAAKYNGGAEYTIPNNLGQDDNYTVTLKATWTEAPKIAINYDRGNAPANASMPTSTSVEKAASGATSFTLDKKTPSRNDNSMVFDYYTANVDLGDPDGKYAPGQTVSIPEGTTSVTLTAHWYKKYYADDGDDDKPSKPSKPTYDEYRIRATCSDGGWVSPAGSTYVREGRNLTVTFAPYKGYAIDGVYIDGVLDNRFDGSYTFRDVDENHTIYVRYVRDSGSSGGSSGGGSHWDDDTSPKTGDASAPLSMGLGVGSLALIAFLVARKMRRA